MYVGASLFTIVEFIELFGDIWLWVCCRTKRRKRPKYAPPTDEDLAPNFYTANPLNQGHNQHVQHHQNNSYGHADSNQDRNNKQNRQSHSRNNGHLSSRGRDNNGFYYNYNGYLERPKKTLPRTPLPMDMEDSQDKRRY